MAVSPLEANRHFTIWSLTPMSGNVAIEALLGRVLQQRGYEPWVIRCNGARERCNTDMINPTVGSRTFLCQSCVAAAETRTAEWAGVHFPVRLLSDLVDRARWQEACAAAAATPDDALWTFEHDGIPFGSWLEVALRLEYFGENWQSLPNLIVVARQWLHSTLAIWAAAHGYFAIERPAGVLCLSGLQPGDRALQAVAERHGVRCFFYEGGQRPGSVILRQGEPACLYEFVREWAEWADVPLSVAESARLDAFLGARRSLGAGMTSVFSPAASADRQAVREQLRLRPGHPLVVAFAGLVVDTSVFKAHDAFASQGDWLEAIVAFAEARPGLDLVVRVHPVETVSVRFAGADVITVRDPAAEVIARRWPVLPPNVRVVEADESVSSYDLTDLADVLATYISTVSLEAATIGKPSLQAGRSHYRSIGFVWPVTSAATFAEQLDALLADPVAPPQAVELARRYAYFWFLRATPQLPGLPFELDDIVKPPPVTIPYWEGDGGPGGLQPIADYLLGEGPFVAPPPAGRHRDDTVPLPIQPPAEPILLVWTEGWSPVALAAEVLRPAGQQRRPWQIVLVAEPDRLAAVARVGAEALRLAGGPAVPIRVVPLEPGGLLEPTWCELAFAYLPPRAGAAPADALAEAYGWLGWEQLMARQPEAARA
jgi:hypothetical protein